MSKIRIYSFGLKHRSKPEGVVFFDVRGLENPWRVQTLKGLTGKHTAVKDFVMADPKAETILASAIRHVTYGEEEIHFGCLGGRHRSVAMAEVLKDRLEDFHIECEVTHMELPSN